MNGRVTDQARAPRTYGGQSPDERTARRRRQILDAGRQSFGSVGFRASTVRGICRDAHVADRYFYELFPTMEDLLVAVYLECIDTLTDAAATALSTAPPGADTSEFVRRGLDGFFAAVQDRTTARVVWLEVLGVAPQVDSTYLATMRKFGDFMTSYLAQVLPEAADAEFTDRLVTAAVGGLSHTALTWLMDDYRTPRADLVEGSVRFVVGVLEAARPTR